MLLLVFLIDELIFFNIKITVLMFSVSWERNILTRNTVTFFKRDKLLSYLHKITNSRALLFFKFDSLSLRVN